MKRAEAFDKGATAFDSVCLMLDISSSELARMVDCSHSTILRMRQGLLRGTKQAWSAISSSIKEMTGREYDPRDLAEDWDGLKDLPKKIVRGIGEGPIGKKKHTRSRYAKKQGSMQGV